MVDSPSYPVWGVPATDLAFELCEKGGTFDGAAIQQVSRLGLATSAPLREPSLALNPSEKHALPFVLSSRNHVNVLVRMEALNGFSGAILCGTTVLDFKTRLK
jgi:hypothetical protein